MHCTDNYSQHSSIICAVWLNSSVFIYDLSFCGFKSSCLHLAKYVHIFGHDCSYNVRFIFTNTTPHIFRISKNCFIKMFKASKQLHCRLILETPVKLKITRWKDIKHEKKNVILGYSRKNPNGG